MKKSTHGFFIFIVMAIAIIFAATSAIATPLISVTNEADMITTATMQATGQLNQVALMQTTSTMAGYQTYQAKYDKDLYQKDKGASSLQIPSFQHYDYFQHIS